MALPDELSGVSSRCSGTHRNIAGVGPHDVSWWGLLCLLALHGAVAAELTFLRTSLRPTCQVDCHPVPAILPQQTERDVPLLTDEPMEEGVGVALPQARSFVGCLVALAGDDADSVRIVGVRLGRTADSHVSDTCITAAVYYSALLTLSTSDDAGFFLHIDLDAKGPFVHLEALAIHVILAPIAKRQLQRVLRAVQVTPRTQNETKAEADDDFHRDQRRFVATRQNDPFIESGEFCSTLTIFDWPAVAQTTSRRKFD